jgi:hypothetical protein
MRGAAMKRAHPGMEKLLRNVSRTRRTKRILRWARHKAFSGYHPGFGLQNENSMEASECSCHMQVLAFHHFTHFSLTGMAVWDSGTCRNLCIFDKVLDMKLKFNFIFNLLYLQLDCI